MKRKLVVTEFLTLDGVMEEPGDWPKGYWNDEIAKFKNDELFSTDALLLGRITYDLFAESWPTMKDTGEFGERMNSLPKYVVSKDLKNPSWNNTHVISNNIPKEITKLKEQPGQDIVVHGSGVLLKTLMEHNLVDEYRFLLYPFLLGKGKRLFKEGSTFFFKLNSTKKFSTGVILLTYLPKE